MCSNLIKTTELCGAGLHKRDSFCSPYSGVDQPGPLRCCTVRQAARVLWDWGRLVMIPGAR